MKTLTKELLNIHRYSMERNDNYDQIDGVMDGSGDWVKYSDIEYMVNSNVYVFNCYGDYNNTVLLDTIEVAALSEPEAIILFNQMNKEIYPCITITRKITTK